MRRPGYLGSLDEFWGVRNPRRNRSRLGQAQILRQLGYLGKHGDDHDDDRQDAFRKQQEHRKREVEEAAKEQQKAAEKAAKEQQKAAEKARERQQEAAEDQRERQQEAAEDHRERQQEAAEERWERQPNAAATSFAPPAEAPVSAAPAAIAPDTLVATPDTVPVSEAAKPPPLIIVQPGMPQPAQRARALPGRPRPRPSPKPVVTSQMARLGKVAAAVGAAMFLF